MMFEYLLMAVFAFVSGGAINYEPSNSSRLKEYLRADASAMYRFKLSNSIRAQAGVSVWNLFDTKNVISQFYRITNNQVEEVRQDALGITPNGVFRVLF